MNLNNTQCPFCKMSMLRTNLVNIDSKEILEQAITCENCGQSYDCLWGTPYLGVFREDDILSLFEIASNADEYFIDDDTQNPSNDFLFWINLIEEYTNASEPENVLLEHGITQAPYWFDYRYGEHLLFKTLTKAIDLQGKHVLDVGAGSGYDSLKFHLAGAEVTCLEFNPVLCRSGFLNFPQLRWVGGVSDSLPFTDSQFDVVVSNAALHHLTDLPQSLQECLRVLKPGGFLITMSDPFMGNETTEEQEASIFNAHTSVLSGINEQVPKFSKFIETFRKYAEILDVKVFTKAVYGLLLYPNEWRFEDALERFSNLGGDIHFLVKKKSNATFPQKMDLRGMFRPSEYAKHLKNQASGVNWLVDFIPQTFLDLALLDNQFPKFHLLNGWKLYQEGATCREAYKRARSFFSNEKLNANILSVTLLIPYRQDYDNPTIEIKLNSETVISQEIIRGVWYALHLPLQAPKTIRSSLVEIRLHTNKDSDASKIFYVQNIDVGEEKQNEKSDNAPKLEYFGLETLSLTVFKGTHKLCLLLSPDFDNAMSIINRLRSFNYFLELIVPEGQENFYSWVPNCRVVEQYPNYELSLHIFSNYKLIHTVDVIIASDHELDKALSKLFLNNSNKKIYQIRQDGTAELFHSFDEIQKIDEKEVLLDCEVPTETSTHLQEYIPSFQSGIQSSQQDSDHSLKKRIQYLEEELKKNRIRLRKVSRELRQAKDKYTAVESSKFWKIRERWLKIKRTLGLKTK